MKTNFFCRRHGKNVLVALAENLVATSLMEEHTQVSSQTLLAEGQRIDVRATQPKSFSWSKTGETEQTSGRWKAPGLV